MYKFIKCGANVVAHLFFRVKIKGKENIPSEGAYILCGNHLHAFDSVLLIVNTKRKLHFMAKKVLFKNWFMKLIQKPFGLIPVDRERDNDIHAIKEAFKVLKDGEILAIFPEGTRNGLAKNEELKNGVGFLVAKTGVKVIPVGIKGTFKLFSKATYNIGEPLDFSEYCEKKASKEDIKAITNSIMDTIIQLTKEEI